MIKIYVLDSMIEEVSQKTFLELTEEDFKVLGKSYTLEEFEYALNNPDLADIYLHRDWIKFIEVNE